MAEKYVSEKWWASGTAVVVWIAVGTVVVHLATGWRYGFDRDELMALEDARHLAWGYVQYPPMTAFFGWLALKLFGTSLVGFRLFAAVAQALAVVLTGMMAKEMGGGKWAMVVAALAGVPFCLGAGALMQYISFDYLCWVVVAWGVVKVAAARTGRESHRRGIPHSGDSVRNDVVIGRQAKGAAESQTGPRVAWWLVVGAGIGLGMLAKYTMLFLVCGVVAGILFTPMRKHLRSGWLWLGAAVAVGIFAPNFIWEWRHGFVSLDFLRFLHVRDVGEGLTDWFLVGQLEITLLAAPLALAGLWFCFAPGAARKNSGEWRVASGEKRHEKNGTNDGEELDGQQFRILGWMYVVLLILYLVMRGRDYYLAPGYPMLYAMGAVWVERKWRVASGKRREKTSEELEEGERKTQVQHRPGEKREKLFEKAWLGKVIWVCLILDVVVAGAVALPVAPVNSRWWRFASQVDSVFPEEIGWPEFVEAVAQVRDRLPVEERGRVAILAGNYGEVGALNLYGEKYGLPRAISGVNSSWERGYGDPAEVVIVVGYSREFLEGEFASCEVGGRVWNRYGVMNEETIEDPEIFVCRGLKGSWEAFWRKVRKFA